ncbi:MAG: hypothetical protein AAGK32_14400 [Actinomycetota bacterium]
MLDVHHKLPASTALTTSYYAAPQEPDDARLLFEAASISAGLTQELTLPLPAGRGIASSLVLAREWELVELAERIEAGIEASYEPTWDHARGEFTWGLGLDEPHPRGQFNAFLAAAEAAGPGLWTRLSAGPVERCPQVVGVDFPAVALRRAEWVDGELHLGLAPLAPDPGATTTFQVIGVAPGTWAVEGQPAASATVTDRPAEPDGDGSTVAIAVEAPRIDADLVLRRIG